eukprot:Gb_24117 [translate_table: standard]
MVTKKKKVEESFLSQSRNGARPQESRPSWVLSCSMTHSGSNPTAMTLLTLTQPRSLLSSQRSPCGCQGAIGSEEGVSSALERCLQLGSPRKLNKGQDKEWRCAFIAPRVDLQLDHESIGSTSIRRRIPSLEAFAFIGHGIETKEETRRIEKDVIIQRLYQGYEGTKVWSRSNGFIINTMAHEGAKWAARILARKLICSEAKNYISHQWAAIVLKVATGITYAWAPCIEQTKGLPEDLVPSPALKKIREKIKGRFNPSIQIVDGVLTTKSAADQAQKERAQLSDKISVLTSKIGKLDIQPSEGESTTTIEVPSDIKPYVELPRQKAKVLKKIPLTSSVKETKFSELKMNYASLQLRCGNSQVKDDSSPVCGCFKKAIDLGKLATLHTQLATRKILLNDGYLELVQGNYLSNANEVNSTDTTSRGLNKKGRNALDYTLQFTGSEGQEIEELSQQARSLFSPMQEMRETQAKLAHLSEKRPRIEIILYQPPVIMSSLLLGTNTRGPSSTRLGPSRQASTNLLSPLENPVPDPSREEIVATKTPEDKVGTTSEDPDSKTPSSSSPLHMAVFTPPKRENILGSSLIVAPPFDPTLIEKAPIHLL